MRISKLLNNFFLLFFFILILESNSLSNEPIDIWNLNNKDKINKDNDTKSLKDYKINIEKNFLENANLSVFDVENLDSSNIQLIGIYDPQENNLTIDMWKFSDADQIVNMLKKN